MTKKKFTPKVLTVYQRALLRLSSLKTDHAKTEGEIQKLEWFIETWLQLEKEFGVKQ